jgi:hypothetical protein
MLKMGKLCGINTMRIRTIKPDFWQLDFGNAQPLH